MSNYNGETYISDAIQSVIDQTLHNWELIIIDDQSTDKSIEIIRNFIDRRIILLKNSIRSGPAICRNIGLNQAKGKYIAILDSDDIMCKERLNIQYNYMENHNDIDVLGSSAEYFDKDRKYIVKPHLEHKMIVCKILFDSPFTHSSVMIRRETLVKNDIKYNEDFPKAQDYDLWATLADIENVKFSALPNVLVRYRIHNQQITIQERYAQRNFANEIRYRQLKILIKRNSENLNLLCKILGDNLIMKKNELQLLEQCLIEVINTDDKRYDQRSLQLVCSNYFRNKCLYNLKNKIKSGNYYWQSELKRYDHLPKLLMIKMKVAKFLLKMNGD